MNKLVTVGEPLLCSPHGHPGHRGPSGSSCPSPSLHGALLTAGTGDPRGEPGGRPRVSVN